jgi:hypothetical protein
MRGGDPTLGKDEVSGVVAPNACGGDPSISVISGTGLVCSPRMRVVPLPNAALPTDTVQRSLRRPRPPKGWGRPGDVIYGSASPWSRAMRTSSIRPPAYSWDSAWASSNGGWKPTPSHCWVVSFQRSLPTSKFQAVMPRS